MLLREFLSVFVSYVPLTFRKMNNQTYEYDVLGYLSTYDIGRNIDDNIDSSILDLKINHVLVYETGVYISLN